MDSSVSALCDEIRSYKGLEFDTVFVVGMEEQLFPSLMAYDSTRQMEEERARWLALQGSGFLWVMVSGFAGATAAELGMGLFYRHALRVDFWDYSNLKFHLGGLVCLRFCLYWTVLALGLIYAADPLVIPLHQCYCELVLHFSRLLSFLFAPL